MEVEIKSKKEEIKEKKTRKMMIIKKKMATKRKMKKKEEEELLKKEKKCLNMENYHCGNIPHPPSLDLINHIMNAIPDLQISREELREKIIVYKENFNKVRELQGDNRDMDRPVDDEFFDLRMLLWGNQPDDDDHHWISK
ncbi:hypothetical protein CQW23_17901 [Capsicum baccatum]|uniref:Uncharacterized protein n=1 Tax=Capsicum baccatum TaxID=33114 RepID=A0A2G2WF47_CAPBA|nr:hypothetical protein CQW23_17901 [Capsicum baccatum]